MPFSEPLAGLTQFTTYYYCAIAFSAAGTGFGAVVSFAVGLVALLFLRQIVARGRFWAFAIYLVPLGFALIAFDVLGGR